MATKLGVQATKLAALPLQLAEQGHQGGRVLSHHDSYELSADLASGDVIKIGGLLPAGARVIDVRIFFDDLDAAGGTVDVGWQASADAAEAADADGFLANVDVTSQGSASMFEDQPSVPGYQKTFTAAVQPVVTTDGDTDATSGTVDVEILYVVD